MSRWGRAFYVATRSLLRRTPLNELVRRSRDGKAARDWRRRAYRDPVPPFVKTATILEYARRFELTGFVETGTYLGDTTAFCAPYFEELTTIELDGRLADAARLRFADEPKVTVLEGDSGELIYGVVERLEQPTLFWLDAHYSAGVTARGQRETPIVAELESILHRPQTGHVILIDDADCFGSWPDYPDPDRLEEAVASLAPGHRLYRGANIFRIHAPDGDRKGN